jgi:hypothetical protein
MATAKKPTSKALAERAARAKAASDAAQAAAAARGQKPGTRKDGGVKVFWTAAEHARLAKVAAVLLHNKQVKTAREALMAAQLDPRAELPEERRRPTTHFSQEKWFPRMLSAEVAKLQDADEDAKDKAHAAHTAHTEGWLGAEAAALAPAAPPEPAPIVNRVDDKAATIGHAFLNLRAMLVDELAAVFVEAALKAMGSGLLGVQPQVELAPATPGLNGDQQQHRIVFHREASPARKPSVLVVGLKGAQKTEIERSFADRFELRFVGADESKDHLRSATEKADTTVLVTDFISHSHQDIVKARSPRYLLSAGGMTNLKATLAGLTN